MRTYSVWAFSGVLACSAEVDPGESAVRDLPMTTTARITALDPPIELPLERLVLGTTQEGSVALVGSTRGWVLESQGLTPRILRSEEVSAEALAPLAVEPGDAGAFVLMEGAVYRLGANYLTEDFLIEGALDLSYAAQGSMAGLWISTESGVWQVEAERRTRFALSDERLAKVSIDRSGEYALAGNESALVLVRQDAATLRAEWFPDSLVVHDVVAGQTRTFAATSFGLVFRDADVWNRLKLPSEPKMLAADPFGSAVYIGDGEEVWRFDEESLEHLEGSIPKFTAMSVDRSGDLFLLAEGGLVRARTGPGEVADFSDVTPFLETYCSRCHANQTANFLEYEVFVDRAELALQRVRTGDMPRCEGGSRCPNPLSADEYAVLERWIRGGKSR